MAAYLIFGAVCIAELVCACGGGNLGPGDFEGLRSGSGKGCPADSLSCIWQTSAQSPFVSHLIAVVFAPETPRKIINFQESSAGGKVYQEKRQNYR